MLFSSPKLRRLRLPPLELTTELAGLLLAASEAMACISIDLAGGSPRYHGCFNLFNYYDYGPMTWMILGYPHGLETPEPNAKKMNQLVWGCKQECWDLCVPTTLHRVCFLLRAGRCGSALWSLFLQNCNHLLRLKLQMKMCACPLESMYCLTKCPGVHSTSDKNSVSLTKDTFCAVWYIMSSA